MRFGSMTQRKTGLWVEAPDVGRDGIAIEYIISPAVKMLRKFNYVLSSYHDA